MTERRSMSSARSPWGLVARALALSLLGGFAFQVLYVQGVGPMFEGRSEVAARVPNVVVLWFICAGIAWRTGSLAVFLASATGLVWGVLEAFSAFLSLQNWRLEFAIPAGFAIGPVGMIVTTSPSGYWVRNVSKESVEGAVKNAPWTGPERE